MVKLEIECPHCKKVVRHNIHRAESTIVLANFAAIVVLAVLAYRYQRQDLVLLAVGVAITGAAALPLLEHVWLRTWPRYVAAAPKETIA